MLLNLKHGAKKTGAVVAATVQSVAPSPGGIFGGGGYVRLACMLQKEIYPPNQPLNPPPHPPAQTHTTFAALLADLSTLSDFLSGRSLSPGLVGDVGGVEGSATLPSPSPTRPSSPTLFFLFFFFFSSQTQEVSKRGGEISPQTLRLFGE